MAPRIPQMLDLASHKRRFSSSSSPAAAAAVSIVKKEKKKSPDPQGDSMQKEATPQDFHLFSLFFLHYITCIKS